jgi:hypothetical protein
MIIFMDIEFLPNNTHLDNPHTFAENDIHLRRMEIQSYIFHSPIIIEIPPPCSYRNLLESVVFDVRTTWLPQ